MNDISLTISLIFLVTSAFIIYFIRKKHAWKVLLVTSFLFFTLIAGKDVLLILVLAGFTYTFSLLRYRKWMLFIILLPLFLKKTLLKEYFFGDLLLEGGAVKFIGLSYITFNAISYLIDIKRKYIKPESNFLKLTLYLFYFPIVFSGPLTRAKLFFTSIENIKITPKSLSSGFQLILWGVFKSFVLSNRLLVLIKNLLDLELKGILYLFVGFVFFLYLYFSFSSIISIFQGISIVFNIPIKSNFNSRIYFSSSREMFWKGWHITLNNWFKDYFFYEIVCFDKKQKYINLLLFITFLLIALWHDFTLVFLLWGALNATWLIAERKYKKYINLGKYSYILGVFYHTLISSFLATIFISKNIQDIINQLFANSNKEYDYSLLLLTPNIFIIIFAFLYADYFERKTINKRFDIYLSNQKPWKRYLFYYTTILIVLIFSSGFNLNNYYNAF